MLARLRRWLEVVESALLVALLATMIGVAAYQVLARNLFGGGLVWGDDLVQVAMLWVTMIGAMAASAGDGHIKIDLVARFAGPRLRDLAERVTSLFAAVLCAALGWYSINFIRWDFIDGTVGFGVVPAWVCESVIPAAAAVMALRFLSRAIWPSAAAPPSGDESAAARGDAG